MMINNKIKLVKKGLLFVISAPSGAGKTTICRRGLEIIPDLQFSVSYTTREKRFGEIEASDYFFISKEVFKRMINKNQFFEWAEVYSNYYGTSKELVKNAIGRGEDVLLDIDIQGVGQLKKENIRAIYIFIMPPSTEVLEKRLRGRHSESEEMIDIRLKSAYIEIQAYQEYDYLIINNNLDKSVDYLKAIITAERCKLTNLKIQEG
ncbi:MAG: guanylate kinase [bacterium]